MSPDPILQQAQAAIKNGDRTAARQLLRQAIEVDPGNEIAWLWLSALVEDPAQERQCLERVIAINPDNAVAQRHLQRIRASDDTPTYLAVPDTPSYIDTSTSATPSYIDTPTPEPAATPAFVANSHQPPEPPDQESRSASMLEMWGSGFTLSCISPTFYQYAARSRLSGAIGFFILFALALTLVQTLNIYRGFGTLGQEVEGSFATGRFPEITISSGRARLKGENPFVREDADSIIILDTTGTYGPSHIASGRYRSAILLTSTTLYNLNNGELQSIDLGELQAMLGDPFVVDAHTIQTLLNWLQIGIFVMLLLWNTIARLAFLAVGALPVWGITRAIRSDATLRLVFAVGVYAVVPATYGTQLLSRTGITFCGRQTILLLVVWIIGLVAALVERKGGIVGGTRSLRAWRAAIGIPMLLVIALDAVFVWQYGSAAAWLVTLLTLLALAGVGLWPILREQE